MQTINLKQYYPFCKEDIFVEVSDEIVEAFLLGKRTEAARDRKMFRYKAFYSLDCNDGIENAAIGWAQPSPVRPNTIFSSEADDIFQLATFS